VTLEQFSSPVTWDGSLPLVWFRWCLAVIRILVGARFLFKTRGVTDIKKKPGRRRTLVPSFGGRASRPPPLAAHKGAPFISELVAGLRTLGALQLWLKPPGLGGITAGKKICDSHPLLRVHPGFFLRPRGSGRHPPKGGVGGTPGGEGVPGDPPTHPPTHPPPSPGGGVYRP